MFLRDRGQHFFESELRRDLKAGADISGVLPKRSSLWSSDGPFSTLPGAPPSFARASPKVIPGIVPYMCSTGGGAVVMPAPIMPELAPPIQLPSPACVRHRDL